MSDSSTSRRPQDGGPLVITLCSTSVPMMLQLPLLSVFAGLTVFRSRAIEEGRERFRMHLGYFYDLERAEKVLVAARRFYPGAFLAAAPQGGMGSLDDTLNAAFQFAKGPATRLVAAERLPTEGELGTVRALPATRVDPAYDDHTGADAVAAGETGVVVDADGPAAEDSAVAAAASDAESDAPAVAAGTSGALSAEPAAIADASRVAADAPAVASDGPAPATDTPAAPADRVAIAAAPLPVPGSIALDGATPILDVAPPAHALLADAGESSAAPGSSARARDRGLSVQRYAVQLRWSLRPTDPQSIPHHAIFRQFTLYGVTVQRGDASEHGLRLGFFSNLYSAKQVADYVRHDFPHASVVPVSERELVRAQQAAWNELLARVGVQARRAASPDDESRSVRRDRGLRRLWGRQS